MNVSNMTGRTGRAVANQFSIQLVNGRYFQSYGSIIVFIPSYDKCMQNDGTFGKSHILLDKTYWDYSTTTGKYRNQFLGETKRETEKKIKSGKYVLTNLN